MPRRLSEVITHIRAVCANPAVDTTLIQTEDLLALCLAADGAGEFVRFPMEPTEELRDALNDFRAGWDTFEQAYKKLLSAAESSQKVEG